MGDVKSVGLGEWFATNEASVTIAAIGLGSCIALAAFDPVARVGGMIHIVLPDSGNSSHSSREECGAKFADVGIPVLVDDLQKLGAIKTRLIVKMAGGAQMLALGGMNLSFNIGERNIEAVRRVLKNMGIPLRGEDVGGTNGRTMRLYMETGQITVRAIGSAEREL